MLNKIKKWFSKSDDDKAMLLPEEAHMSFVLKLGNTDVGTLKCDAGIWEFSYSNDFKLKSDELKPIVGFNDLDKVYKSETLWPFFRIRIPGLKQPKIQAILKKEEIDIKNEAALLRRFGKETIANPYSLMAL